MLEISNLTAGYGRIPVLRNINMKVMKGEIVAVLGPNGAGKSTLLATIMNLTTIHHGEIRYKQVVLNKLKTHEITKLGIGYVPQSENVFPNLTVEENLIVGAYSKRKNFNIQKEMEDVLSLFPEIERRRKQKAKTLSGGERQMLAIARALIAKPKLLLLDEPTAGLAPVAATALIRKIKEIKETAHVTVLIAEQNVKKTLEVADRAYVLVGGSIIGSYLRSEFSADNIERMFFRGRK